MRRHNGRPARPGRIPAYGSRLRLPALGCIGVDPGVSSHRASRRLTEQQCPEPLADDIVASLRHDEQDRAREDDVLAGLLQCEDLSHRLYELFWPEGAPPYGSI